MLRLAVLISGAGSNLRAIQAAIDRGECRAEIAGVVSDRAKAEGLRFAESCGLANYTVRLRDHDSRAGWTRALASTVAALEPELVVLAGFMKIVEAEFVTRFEHRIINVHPALLPAFPGLDAPAQAIAAGVRLSGCSVHLVDAGVDTGPVLAQAAVRVTGEDTPETLHARIQGIEHSLLPRVIDAVAQGRLELGDSPRWAAPERCEGTFVSPAVLS